MSTPASRVIAGFGTLCGATVDLIRLDDRRGHTWHCNGCGNRALDVTGIDPARRAANDHAATCRSLPRT
jgi:hypothetical protein